MEASVYRQLSQAVDQGADLRDRLDQLNPGKEQGSRFEPVRALIADVQAWSRLVGAQMPVIDLEHDAPQSIKDRLLAFLDRQIPVVHRRRFES